MFRSMMYVAMCSVPAYLRRRTASAAAPSACSGRVAVEVERLLWRDPPTLGGTVEDGLEVGLLGHRERPFRKG